MLERLPGNLEGAGGCRDIVAVAAQGRCQEILLTGIHVGFQGLGVAGRNGPGAAWLPETASGLQAVKNSL